MTATKQLKFNEKPERNVDRTGSRRTRDCSYLLLMMWGSRSSDWGFECLSGWTRGCPSLMTERETLSKAIFFFHTSSTSQFFPSVALWMYFRGKSYAAPVSKVCFCKHTWANRLNSLCWVFSLQREQKWSRTRQRGGQKRKGSMRASEI